MASTKVQQGPATPAAPLFCVRTHYFTLPDSEVFYCKIYVDLK